MSIEGAVRSIDSVLVRYGFGQIDEWSWGREISDVYQYVYMSEKKSGAMRVAVFIQLRTNPAIALGGTMTNSSILPGGYIGGDVGWDLSQRSVHKEIVNAIESVALPFFDLFITEAILAKVAETFSTSDYHLELPDRTLPEFEPSERVFKATNELATPPLQQDVYHWWSDAVHADLAALGFVEHSSKCLTYVRDRGEISDVVRFTSINYGLHVGISAFNWIPELALDGSGVYNDESALVLNGGLVSQDGSFIAAGSAFLTLDEAATRKSARKALDLLRTLVIPKLELVVDWPTFRQSISPKLVSTAKRIPALSDRFDE